MRLGGLDDTKDGGEGSPDIQHLMAERQRLLMMRGVGEWNHYYIRAINGEVRLWVNGYEVSGGNQCEPASGFVCLEAEGAPIDFRNIKIRVLP